MRPPDLIPGHWCYYIPAVQDDWNPDLHTHGYVPAIVQRNEPGFHPMLGRPGGQPWYWGKTLGEAERVAEQINTEMGITPREAFRIVSSSMGASRRTRVHA